MIRMPLHSLFKAAFQNYLPIFRKSILSKAHTVISARRTRIELVDLKHLGKQRIKFGDTTNLQ